MKQIFFALFAALILFGCEKFTDDYYVKYAGAVDTRYIQVPLDIVITDENNHTEHIDATDSWSRIIGPVNKKFNASISVATEGSPNNMTLLAKIYVSKNDDPFVLKESDESTDTSIPLQIDYTIDF
jgi:hypothetical protein